MLVYIVYYNYAFAGFDIKGVFSSKQVAMDFLAGKEYKHEMDRIERSYEGYSIETHIVDSELEGGL